MRSHKVSLSLRDGAHTDLVKTPGKEGSEGATEDDVPVPASQTNAHTADVLLGNEALDVAIGECVLVSEGEGGVLCVTIQCYNTIVVLPKLNQGITIHFTSGNLRRESI